MSTMCFAAERASFSSDGPWMWMRLTSLLCCQSSRQIEKNGSNVNSPSGKAAMRRVFKAQKRLEYPNIRPPTSASSSAIL